MQLGILWLRGVKASKEYQGASSLWRFCTLARFCGIALSRRPCLALRHFLLFGLGFLFDLLALTLFLALPFAPLLIPTIPPVAPVFGVHCCVTLLHFGNIANIG